MLCDCESCPMQKIKDTTKKEYAKTSCGRIRRLTPRECWRLQSFADELFEKAQTVNSDNQLYQQAGNSVTIPVVYAVGLRIMEAQRKYEQAEMVP